MLELRKITEENFHECLALDSGLDQEEFVDSMTYSLAEAWLYGDNFQPRAIYQDSQLVGFASFYVGEEHYQIINFLIDKEFHGQGVGIKAAQLCIHYLKNQYGATKISNPVHQNHQLAKYFWKKLGFQESSVIEEDYIFMRLNI
ncbi:GNAT family N-acetyltransferase [Streptococcus merionis]|uniref:GNAT family N-acetyltransferase n=1 Tax=Streptococcus merionis TaxID=400065 RepID=UPI003513EF03